MLDDRLPQAFSAGRLRRLRESDLEAFQAYRRIPELGRYQGWSLLSDAEAIDFLAEMNTATLFRCGEWTQLGIADAASDELIGDIGLFVSLDGRSGEVGVTLVPGRQGRGIATAAVHAALQLLFLATPVNRVLGIADSRNVASLRLLERAGFERQETRQVLFRGEPCTEHVYALDRPGRGGQPDG